MPGSDPEGPTPFLNAHRHDNVLEVGVVRDGNQGRRIRVAQRDVDIFALQVVQHVQQIGHVEADVDRVAAVVDFQFLDRFFLVGIGRADFHAAWGDDAAHALELVAGHDGGALQGTQQFITADGEVVFVALWNHARVVRELAFHQFRDQLDVGKGQFYLVGGDVQLYRLVVFFQQTLQFDDGLARDNDFLARKSLLGRHLAESQTMAIGGYGDDVIAIQNQQQAIQVVADVLLRL